MRTEGGSREFADWSRQVNVLAGSGITLAATLDKN
jgi:hypothetical protein